MFDSTKPTLYLVRGVSGAGKSTFARILADSLRISYCEADQYFMKDGVYNFDPLHLPSAHSDCRYRTKLELSIGKSVVVSNTTTTTAEVNFYHDMAKLYRANFVSLIVENRNGTMSVHDVPEEVLQRQRNRFSVKL